jgi:hypothetical protein
VIRGGDLTFVLKTSVAGFSFEVKSERLAVRGQNPSEGTVRSYIQQVANGQGLGAYVGDLGLIARRESSYRQFINNLPFFSPDRLGGAGLYQITPATTGDLVWNWQKNVDAGVGKFSSTVSRSQRLHILIQGPIFRSRVQELNNWRVSQGLQPIPFTQVYVPPLDAGQIRRNAIRGFNGYAGTDAHLGGVLSEYTLSFNSNGLLDLTYNAVANRWEARWERVPESQRPGGATPDDPNDDVGDPFYVRNVLGEDL